MNLQVSHELSQDDKCVEINKEMRRRRRLKRAANECVLVAGVHSGEMSSDTIGY